MSNKIRILPTSYDTGKASRAFYRAATKVDNPANFSRGNDYEVTVVWEQRTFSALTGLNIPLKKARGYRFESREGPVIPTYDFEEVAMGKMNLVPVVIYDFLTARQEIGRPAPTWPTEDLILYPCPSDFEEFCREARESEFVAWDLETPWSRKADEDEEEMDPSYSILRASVALPSFRATTFPWQEPFIGMFKMLMEMTNSDKVGYNSEHFDLPRLWHNGIHPKGRLVDTMWLWHFVQPSLPRSLGAVTTMYDRVPEWKSIGSSQDVEGAELYAAMDARETAKCLVGIKEDLRKRRIE